ncbi:hypothetical protein RUND412_004389 [Rhizina undulata]
MDSDHPRHVTFREGRGLLGLPDELLVQIVSYLPPESVVPLHRASQRLRNLTRTDTNLWRSLCAYKEALENAACLSQSQNFPNRSASPLPAIASYTATTATTITPKVTPTASWPVVGIPEQEDIDWYNEYKFRHAPLKLRWCSPSQRPRVDRRSASVDFHLFPFVSTEDEVKGVSVFSSEIGGAKDMIFAPLSDGSVALWSLKESDTRRLVARSREGLIFPDGDTGRWRAGRRARDVEIVDGVSVCAETGKVFVAEKEGLVQIDLETLQKITTHRFPFSITALSPTSTPHPLTIGTTLMLHLLDPRVSTPVGSAPLSPTTPFTDDERVQPFGQVRPQYKVHAPLFQPGPLTILHNENVGRAGPEGEIYVAGHFPSILCYERRNWPRLRGTMPSGGHLCGLAMFSSSLPEERETSSTIVACGEFNGRGTLELYPLAATTSYTTTTPTNSPQAINEGLGYPFPSRAGPTPIRNRQYAQRILTVAMHGCRIVTGDSEGHIRWTERDGMTHVRSLPVRTSAPPRPVQPTTASSHRGLGRSAPAATGIWEFRNEVVRKLISTEGGVEGEDELIVWSGDTLGVLTCGPEDGMGLGDVDDGMEEEDDDDEEESEDDDDPKGGLEMPSPTRERYLMDR